MGSIKNAEDNPGTQESVEDRQGQENQEVPSKSLAPTISSRDQVRDRGKSIPGGGGGIAVAGI